MSPREWEPTDYLCECSDTGCLETIELSRDEYEHVRARPTVFVLLPGHEIHEIEDVVERNDDWLLAEMFVATEELLEHDPRAKQLGAA